MAKQIFNGKQLTTTRCVNNILKVYGQADGPSDWYNDAHRFALQLFWEIIDNAPSDFTPSVEKTLNKVVGIIAALSPLKDWDENKRIARLFLETGEISHTKQMGDKAIAIRNGSGEVDEICDILNGPKIVSFFLNILEPNTSGSVTVDRHAISIAVGGKLTNKSLGITAKQYEFFSNCYKVAAMKVDQTPLVVQATTWEIWRKMDHKN